MPGNERAYCDGCSANFSVLSDIRDALGVGHKPMLSELPAIVREVVSDHDEAVRLAAEYHAENANLRGLAGRMREMLNSSYGWRGHDYDSALLTEADAMLKEESHG